MKKLNPVNIRIDSNMNTSEFKQQLVDCVSQLDSDSDIVNLVKVHVGDSIPAYDFSNIVKKCLADPLNDKGITNCIFVPIKKGIIEDITIDYIEVHKNESNS